MRRSRRIRLRDLPRLGIRVIADVAALFAGKYGRIEGAHVLAVDAEGRILVVRTTYLGPGWMLPGGRVERTETPHEAAVRETLEETGIRVTLDRLLLIDAHRPRDVSFVFGGRVVGGDLVPQFGEIAEVGWLDRAEIAATSPRLDRLLTIMESAGKTPLYIGGPSSAFPVPRD